jgi:hypothetical protein
LETETTEVKYNDTEKEREKNSLTKKLVATPIWACEKIDKMFGSGGEAIIHYMWFEQGFKLFEQMMQNSPLKPKEELLKELVEIQCQLGWGIVKATVIRHTPPTVELIVKNPLVKTLKGSQKHIIGSYWAGIFSKYLNKQLTCKDFNYNAEKDEFSCLITTSS